MVSRILCLARGTHKALEKLASRDSELELSLHYKYPVSTTFIPISSPVTVKTWIKANIYRYDLSHLSHRVKIINNYYLTLFL